MGRKQKVGLNLQLQVMVVEIALGVVHLPQHVLLAITNASRLTQDFQARSTQGGGHLQADVVAISQLQLHNFCVKTVQAIIL